MTMAAAAATALVPGQVLSWADRLLGVAASIGMRNTDEESPIVYHKGSECRGMCVDVREYVHVGMCLHAHVRA